MGTRPAGAVPHGDGYSTACHGSCSANVPERFQLHAGHEYVILNAELLPQVANIYDDDILAKRT